MTKTTATNVIVEHTTNTHDVAAITIVTERPALLSTSGTVPPEKNKGLRSSLPSFQVGKKHPNNIRQVIIDYRLTLTVEVTLLTL
jgi:hypothetical protein